MTAKQIEKEVQRQAVLFEEQCQNGQALNNNMKFADFAAIWFKDRKKDLRPKTYERYKSMLPPYQRRNRSYKAVKATAAAFKGVLSEPCRGWNKT